MKKIYQSIFIFPVFVLISTLLIQGINLQAKSNPNPMLSAKAALSQTKFSRKGLDELYIKLDIKSLSDLKSKNAKHKPTDFVIVLDKSGSMSGNRKMDYAKKAIKSLMHQLSDQDRFAWVTFSDGAKTIVPLKKMTQAQRNKVLTQFSSLHPGGSTNLGAGLKMGIDLLQNSHASGRVKRLIMISDGNANLGVTSQNLLNKMAARSNQEEFVFSTIGVGLDFNEVLLASLADHGLGDYYYMEDLNKMETILAKEYSRSHHILAHDLKLKLKLHEKLSLLDASGYPVKIDSDGSKEIKIGHLYEKQKKTIYLSLQLPVKDMGEIHIGNIDLSYQVDGVSKKINLMNRERYVQVVSERDAEAVVQSINKEVYEKSWKRNNQGRFLQRQSAYIRDGKKDEARQHMKEYKNKLKKANNYLGNNLLKEEVDSLAVHDKDLEKTFSNPNSVELRKSTSKSMHDKSLKSRR